MTYEEAKTWLEQYIQVYGDNMKIEQAIVKAIEALEGQILNEAEGCTGCTFASCEEWEMPCRKCKRNNKDYWRAKK